MTTDKRDLALGLHAKLACLEYYLYPCLLRIGIETLKRLIVQALARKSHDKKYSLDKRIMNTYITLQLIYHVTGNQEAHTLLMKLFQNICSGMIYL